MNIKKDILESIKAQNPWHSPLYQEDFTASLKNSQIERITLLTQALGHLDPAFVLILQGPRRVGKSELIKSMISRLLKQEKISPKQICYINCENPLIGTSDFLNSVQSYFQFLFEKEFYEIQEPLYIFIDEVFLVSGWERTLKAAVDLKKQYHFIVTGSSSMQFIINGKHSLAGRIRTLPVKPFSFFETIDLRFLLKEIPSEIYEPLCSVKEKLKKVFDLKELFQNKKGIEAIYYELANIDTRIPPPIKKNLDHFYKLYLLVGGYPDFLKSLKAGGKASVYFTDSILEPIIYKDLSHIHDLTEASRFKINQMIYYLIFRNAQIFTLSELQERLGERHHTRIGELLHTLQTSLLFDLIMPLTEVPLLTRKNKRKVYFNDTGLVHQVTGKLAQIDLQSDFSLQEPYLQIKGYAAETALHQHLKRLEAYWDVCYLRNEKNDRDYEIDFVWKTPFGDFPIECKMRNKGTLGIQIQNFRMMMTSKMNRGLILTANDLRLEDNILCCPHYYFLGAEHV